MFWHGFWHDLPASKNLNSRCRSFMECSVKMKQVMFPQNMGKPIRVNFFLKAHDGFPWDFCIFTDPWMVDLYGKLVGTYSSPHPHGAWVFQEFWKPSPQRISDWTIQKKEGFGCVGYAGFFWDLQSPPVTWDPGWFSGSMDGKTNHYDASFNCGLTPWMSGNIFGRIFPRKNGRVLF